MSKSGVRVWANVNTSNSGVGIVPTTDKEVEIDKIEVPRGLDLKFVEAPYWSDRTIGTDAESYLLRVIGTFSNIGGLHSTPQY